MLLSHHFYFTINSKKTRDRREPFLGPGRVLYLDLDGGYKVVWACKKIIDVCTYDVCILSYSWYTFIFKKNCDSEGERAETATRVRERERAEATGKGVRVRKSRTRGRACCACACAEAGSRVVRAVRARARRPEAVSRTRASRAMEGPSRQGSAEEAEPQSAAWSGDSGNVSQSHSSASGPWEDEGPELGVPGCDLPLLRRAAASYTACLLPGAGVRPEVEALDASLEDLLTRVDEFVGMLDMLRGDSSHVVSEGVPRIYAKATEMRQVYSKIDRLEAFVGMIGASVARLEEQVARAEAELGGFPSTFRKLLHTIHVPSIFNKVPSSRSQQTRYEPPVLFRTEDHFPCCSERPQI